MNGSGLSYTKNSFEPTTALPTPPTAIAETISQTTQPISKATEVPALGTRSNINVPHNSRRRLEVRIPSPRQTATYPYPTVEPAATGPGPVLPG